MSQWIDKDLFSKFAEERIARGTWTHGDCLRFWPFMNAHILMNVRR